MAKLKITLEVDLIELRNLWYLIQNTSEILRHKKVYDIFPGWANSQELNLSRLEDFSNLIETLVEK